MRWGAGGEVGKRDDIGYAGVKLPAQDGQPGPLCDFLPKYFK